MKVGLFRRKILRGGLFLKSHNFDNMIMKLGALEMLWHPNKWSSGNIFAIMFLAGTLKATLAVIF